MQVTITTRFASLDRIDRRLDAGDAVLEKTARDVEARAKLSMTLPKTGREYPRGGRVHRASAPGEAPAIDTGHLAGSIGVRVPGPNRRQVVARSEYAAYLELGTHKMAARPFLAPALLSVRQLLVRRIRTMFDERGRVEGEKDQEATR